MKLQFIKNVQFTKLIKVNGRLREFNFRKPNNSDQSPFSIDVIDEWGSRVMFHMKKAEGEWKLVQPDLPKWILENENTLRSLIMDELKED